MDSLPNTPQPPAPLTPEEVTAFLDFEFEGLISRRAEIIEALRATLAAHPHIDDGDEDTAGKLAENSRMAKALCATAERHRKEHKEPFLQGGRTVDAWFKRYADQILLAARPIETVMFDYATRKEAAQRAEAQRIAREAEEAAARAAEAASKALKQGADDAGDKLDDAAHAANEAAQAIRTAAARPAEHSRSRGMYGAVASIRTTWSWELDDIMALLRAVLAGEVPPAALAVNEAWVREQAKNRSPSGRPTAVIPGIRWVENRSIGVR